MCTRPIQPKPATATPRVARSLFVTTLCPPAAVPPAGQVWTGPNVLTSWQCFRFGVNPRGERTIRCLRSRSPAAPASLDRSKIGPEVTQVNEPAPGRPATIRTVAERAGVSKSLVSLVLRGSPHVSPGQAGGGAAGDGRTGLPAQRHRPPAHRAAHPHRRGAAQRSAQPLVRRLPGGADRRPARARLCAPAGRWAAGSAHRRLAAAAASWRLRVDGLVLVGSMASSPAITRPPRRCRRWSPRAGTSSLPRVDVVANDDWVGTELAVKHLIGLGHRRIAHLAGTHGAVAELRRCRPTRRP